MAGADIQAVYIEMMVAKRLNSPRLIHTITKEKGKCCELEDMIRDVLQVNYVTFYDVTHMWLQRWGRRTGCVTKDL